MSKSWDQSLNFVNDAREWRRMKEMCGRSGGDGLCFPFVGVASHRRHTIVKPGCKEHWQLDCLFISSFRLTTKKSLKLNTLAVCEGNLRILRKACPNQLSWRYLVKEIYESSAKESIFPLLVILSHVISACYIHVLLCIKCVRMSAMWRNNNVIMTPKRRCDVVLTS